MIWLYNEVFYKPIFNYLIWLYNSVPGSDIGLAIIILTITIRLLLYPLSLQSIKSQKALSSLQPQIEELRKKYKSDRERMAQELMGLYKKEKVNPASSCLPTLIQFPFLIAVYQVFARGLASNGFDQYLYPFVSNPGHINTMSFGIIDLAVPNLILAFLAGGAQFIQTRMLIHTKQPPKDIKNPIPVAKDEKLLSGMNKQMMYFMPVITVVIGASLPSGLALYWFLTTLVLALQQVIHINLKKKKVAPLLEESNSSGAEDSGQQ